jgi:Fe-S cluster biogenesis protein NfuA
MSEHDDVKSSGPADAGDTQAHLRERVEEGLKEVRPWLKADGGDVELVEVTDDGVVKVKLSGACGGCPMRDMTLRAGIGRLLKERIPEVKDVESV